MRSTLLALLVILASACATKGVAPLITSESVRVQRGAEDSSRSPASKLADARIHAPETGVTPSGPSTPQPGPVRTWHAGIEGSAWYLLALAAILLAAVYYRRRLDVR
jgi:hypothetical protein